MNYHIIANSSWFSLRQWKIFSDFICDFYPLSYLFKSHGERMRPASSGSAWWAELRAWLEAKLLGRKVGVGALQETCSQNRLWWEEQREAGVLGSPGRGAERLWGRS